MKKFVKGLTALLIFGSFIVANFESAEAAEIADFTKISIETQELARFSPPPPPPRHRHGHRPPPLPHYNDHWGYPPPPHKHGHRPPPRHGHGHRPPPYHHW